MMRVVLCVVVGVVGWLGCGVSGYGKCGEECGCVGGGVDVGPRQVHMLK